MKLNRAHQSCVAAAMVAGFLLVGMARPIGASAHWGNCLDDPKIWLDNGAKIDIGTSIQADRSAIAHLSFTLHVPVGTSYTRIVRTQGVDPSFEAVNVVADSGSTYVSKLVAMSSDGISYPLTVTLHLVNQGSTWSGVDGVTNQVATSSISAP